jgi:hypothetical protein
MMCANHRMAQFIFDAHVSAVGADTKSEAFVELFQGMHAISAAPFCHLAFVANEHGEAQ